MKLNWIERLFVTSPVRVLMQTMEIKWFKKKYPLDSGSEILEIGCGGGVGGGLILESFKPAQLYLSDLDIKMVRRARTYAGSRNLSNVHICQVDATDLPYGDQKFDAVFGFGFLHHVPRWRTSIVPARTNSPPYLFTPRRFALLSRPQRLLPPAFLCAIFNNLFLTPLGFLR